LERQPYAPFAHVLEHEVALGRPERVLERIVLRARGKPEVGENGRVAQVDARARRRSRRRSRVGRARPVPKRSSATPFRWPIFRLPRGQPDRGAGAYQFTGYTIYDPLVAWEMNVADRPGKLVPGRSARPTPVVVVVTSETLKLRPPDVAAVLDEIAKKQR
jgi:hypothetical protein